MLHVFCVTLKHEPLDFQIRFKKPEGFGTHPMISIDDNIKFVTMTLSGKAQELKYTYSRNEGGEESQVQDVTRGAKYQHLPAFFDFVDTGIMSQKKKLLQYLL